MSAPAKWRRPWARMGLLVALLSLPAWAGELPKSFTEIIEGSKEKAAGLKASFTLVLIPGGTFLLGSPPAEEGRAEDEGPPHEVALPPFYLAATEVTFDLWDIYMAECSKPTPDDKETDPRVIERMDREPALPKDPRQIDNLALATLYGVDAIASPSQVYGDQTMSWGRGPQPAIGVGWLNAVNLCRWLSQKTGKHYRLPTEAEWEYAARAGTTTAYFFGDAPDHLGDYAWFEENADERTHPVAEKKPNPWGLYDILGNVREWCHDFYDPTAYATNAQTKPCQDPHGPKLPVGDDTAERHKRFHVARGGAWESAPEELRSAARGKEQPRWRIHDPQYPKSRWWLPQQGHIGLRVACEAASVAAKK